MPRYCIEPINLDDDVWQEYSSEALIIEADNEQQARFLAANRMAGKMLSDSRGTAMPLPPCLVKTQTHCTCID